MSVFLRIATEQDCTKILDIYAPYIRETAITFEYDIPTDKEFAERIRHIQQMYPYIVAEAKNGRESSILGYAYASSFHPRKAYQWDVELSVYVKRDAHRHGLGKALYSALISILKQQNLRNVIGCVTVPNPASEALHKSFGFRTIGTFHAAGFKFEQWHDVQWLEKHMENADTPPRPIIPFQDLPMEKVKALLQEASSSLNI